MTQRRHNGHKEFHCELCGLSKLIAFGKMILMKNYNLLNRF